MAITITDRAGGASGTNHGTGPANTGNFTPNNNTRLLVIVAAQENSGVTGNSDVGAELTVTDNLGSPLSWSKILGETWDSTPLGGGPFNLGLALFTAEVSTGESMQVVCDCGPVHVYSYVLKVYEIGGETTVIGETGQDNDNGSGSGGFSFSLTGTSAADSMVVAAIAVGGGSSSVFTGDTGWTEINEIAVDFQEYQAMHQTAALSSVVWTDATSDFGADFGRAGVAVEIAIAGAGGTPVAVFRDHYRRMKR